MQCKGHWYLALVKTFNGFVLMVPEDMDCLGVGCWFEWSQQTCLQAAFSILGS